MMDNCVVVHKMLASDSPKRVGKMIPTYITIHESETGHELSPSYYNYPDMYEKKLLDNSTSIGYHFMIEANRGDVFRIYQFLETNVSTHHAGDAFGNQNSIGIERLVNVDTEMEKAIDIQAALTAYLMRVYDIPIDHVVPHHYWSGKDCPSRLLFGLYGGWDGFIEKVKAFYDKKIDFNDIILE